MEEKKKKSLVWKADSATPKTTAVHFGPLKSVKDIKTRAVTIIIKVHREA